MVANRHATAADRGFGSGQPRLSGCTTDYRERPRPGNRYAPGPSRLATPDERVVGALLDTVKQDPNVNVRLAAVDALAGLLDRPGVGRGLLEALDAQDAPLMQVTLAELLLAARVDGSAAAVRRMLQRDEVNPAVREQVRQTMGQQI